MEKNPGFEPTENLENEASFENLREELDENELDKVTGGTNPTTAPRPVTTKPVNQPSEEVKLNFSKIEQ